MKKNFGQKTWIVPMPVLMIGTYNRDGSPNLMNAAWGGTYDYNQVFISLSEHKTTDNLERNKEFTLSFATRKTVAASDFVGIVSGNKVPDKVHKAGLHDHKAENVNAPIFDEYPLTLECRVISFNDGLLVGEVINTVVDEEILTNGKIDFLKAEFIVFDTINNKYRLVKEEVGDAFRIGNTLK